MAEQSNHEIRMTRLQVLPPDERMVDSRGWVVSIIRWNRGEAVSVEYMDGDRVIITTEEWLALKNAIDRMIGECRK
jgi:hypothetical protein